MSKLLARLSDASRSGVYRARGDAEVLDATRGSKLDVVRVDLRAAKLKAELLEAFARALAFPRWFGGNWDALEDCLADLSWMPGEGRVILIECGPGIAADDLGVLRDILATVAESWADRGKPFFAVFLGAKATPMLPELFRRKT